MAGDEMSDTNDKKPRRVMMTDEAREMFPRGAHTGEVVGGSRLSKDFIRVRRDGAKTVHTWHSSFWVDAEGK